MENWFSETLLTWYKANKRELPWRNVKDPYKIWLSEVILQQTQVVQGLDYYERFLKRFPGIRQLAAAKEDEVLKLWQGLGYYSRARNLLKAAQQVMQKHGGKFPRTYQDIRSLPGVGEYSSAAICSFCFDQPYAVVDGNVYRVLSRVFGIDLPVDSANGKKHFRELASRLLDRAHPAMYNQAIMEFGSQHCKPRQALCLSCPFSSRCSALSNNQVGHLPIKGKRQTIKTRYFNYLVLFDRKGRLALQRRENKDIWQGLYEFILQETDKKLSLPKLVQSSKPLTELLNGAAHLYTSRYYTHQLSHQLIEARFIVFRIKESIPKVARTVHVDSIDTFAFPRLIDKFLKDCELKEFI